MNAYTNRANEAQARRAVICAEWARKNRGIPMQSSADLAAENAAGFLAQGRWNFAHEWAIESLRYSLGICSEVLRALLLEREGQ